MVTTARKTVFPVPLFQSWPLLKAVQMMPVFFLPTSNDYFCIKQYVNIQQIHTFTNNNYTLCFWYKLQV